jgi:hypothetical protein
MLNSITVSARGPSARWRGSVGGGEDPSRSPRSSWSEDPGIRGKRGRSALESKSDSHA